MAESDLFSRLTLSLLPVGSMGYDMREVEANANSDENKRATGMSVEQAAQIQPPPLPIGAE